jgi:hypothetical protein
MKQAVHRSSFIVHPSSFLCEALMPLAKLTCPKCHATLKPAKPVPEGKRVKCPKCEEMFTAGEDEADARPGARGKSGAPAKKPAATTGDDEDVGTYAVIKDEDDTKKKDQDDRKKRNKKRSRDEDEEEGEKGEEGEEEDVAAMYLKNLKSRDPRGKAQEIIVSPSNWLLRAGLLGFFGWVGVFIIFMIPIAFPNQPKEGEEAEKDKQGKTAPAPKGGDTKDGKDKKAEEKPPEKGLAEQIQEETWSVVLFVFVLLLGLVQSGMIAYGAVKMQSMESYNWSLTSCILTIIPLHVVPVWVLAWKIVGYIMDDYAWGFAAILFLWGPAVGGLCLKEFLRPEVKTGFAFKPD